MARSIKIILFSLLMMTLYGVASNTSVGQAEQVKHAIASTSEQQANVKAPEFPYLPVADLGYSLQTRQLSTTRVQRVQVGEYFFSLRNILLNYANRATSLSINWRRISCALTSYHYKHTGEYYVFALRHIII